MRSHPSHPLPTRLDNAGKHLMKTGTCQTSIFSQRVLFSQTKVSINTSVNRRKENDAKTMKNKRNLVFVKIYYILSLDISIYSSNISCIPLNFNFFLKYPVSLYFFLKYPLSRKPVMGPNYESVFSLLHPHRFLPRLSGEHMVFTEIYEGRKRD